MEEIANKEDRQYEYGWLEVKCLLRNMSLNSKDISLLQYLRKPTFITSRSLSLCKPAPLGGQLFTYI